MRSIDSSSPRKANGAISAPVLTPVTTSNCGRASSPLTRPQPLSTPAPNAPQSPPPDITSTSIVGLAVALAPPAAFLDLLSARFTSFSISSRVSSILDVSSARRAANRSSRVRFWRCSAEAQAPSTTTAVRAAAHPCALFTVLLCLSALPEAALSVDQRDLRRELVANHRAHLALDLHVARHLHARDHFLELGDIGALELDLRFLDRDRLIEQLLRGFVGDRPLVVRVRVALDGPEQTLVDLLQVRLVGVVHWPEPLRLLLGELHVRRDHELLVGPDLLGQDLHVRLGLGGGRQREQCSEREQNHLSEFHGDSP